jgi:hypothetical protein
MGLKFIPLFVLTLGYWVALGGYRDAGFRIKPGWRKAYLLLGLLFLTAEFIAIASMSGDDRVWNAAVYGRWTLLLGFATVVTANVIFWLAGLHCFRGELVSSYGRLFFYMAVAYLVVAFASFVVDNEHNRINRYYLDTRWPEPFIAANRDAIRDVFQLVRGPLKDKAGPDLIDLIENDAGFRQNLRTGVFYNQHSDESFRLGSGAVMVGYRPPTSSDQGRRPFVTMRLPKELADALRFVSIAEEKSK